MLQVTLLGVEGAVVCHTEDDDTFRAVNCDGQVKTIVAEPKGE